VRKLLATLFAALAIGAVLAPAAGAADARAKVEVVGSARLAWHSVAVRQRPSQSAGRLAVLTQFRRDYYPRVVLVLGQRDHPGAKKPLWYRIALAGRPNGRTGWVPAASLAVRPVDRWIVVYRGARRFELRVRGRVVRQGRVAVGAPGMETPLGLFYVAAKFDPSWPVLGAYAFETSAYSKLSEWPGGGVVGMHGTNQPQLLGQAVSHGCIRIGNGDVLYLRSVVPVGTPIKIVA
jgi:lipoprotein-anchoring transpeptidase ErfK/SrfK